MYKRQDQRFVDGRTDVLSYQTAPLTKAMKIEGAAIAEIVAKTTGTDGDFVIRLIDVYPPDYPNQPELGGYQLPVATDIIRGRFRNSFEHPTAIPVSYTHLDVYKRQSQRNICAITSNALAISPHAFLRGFSSTFFGWTRLRLTMRRLTLSMIRASTLSRVRTH